MKALRLSIVMILLCGLGYPLLMTGLVQAFFPEQANGSLLKSDGNIIGSRLIGQSFTDPRFFHGRVSSIQYNAGASGASNLAPSNPELIKRIENDAKKWLADHPGATLRNIPMDLLTNSGSGLDPDITPEAARFQIPRVAKTTGISPQQLEHLIQMHTEGRDWGVFGEPRVNVLLLNLDLQRMIQRRG